MRPTQVALLLCVGCVTFPVAPAPSRALLPKGLPVLKPCRLTSERTTRWLFEGVDDLTFAPWHTGFFTVLIHHPSGWLAIDPAVGTSIESDIHRAPLYFKSVMGQARTKVPLPALLDGVGLDPENVDYALVTHVHWDHVGALRDLPRAKVLLSREEYEWSRSLKGTLAHGTMPHMLRGDTVHLAPFALEGGRYEAFPRSHDLFGDGSVVAVPLPGHTPGSVGYFVNSGDGKRWLFTGDASWTIDGIRRPAHKNPLASLIVDSDRRALEPTLATLHAYLKRRLDVTLVPAHDADAFGSIPECTPQLMR